MVSQEHSITQRIFQKEESVLGLTDAQLFQVIIRKMKNIGIDTSELELEFETLEESQLPETNSKVKSATTFHYWYLAHMIERMYESNFTARKITHSYDKHQIRFLIGLFKGRFPNVSP
jgi:hypothetical protein